MIRNFADAVRSANPIIFILIGMMTVLVALAVVFFPEIARADITLWNAIEAGVRWLGEQATR